VRLPPIDFRPTWDFHVAAIHAALADSEIALGELPAGERDFAEAWGMTVVRLLAIADFPTTTAVVRPLNGPCVLPAPPACR
jgi:hypothetical protein